MLITLRDAAREFQVSERTLHELVRRHGLTRFRRPGDRRTWLERERLEEILRPHPKAPPLKPLAAAIITRRARVLMTRRRYTQHGEHWSWPSGRPEPGESLQDAIKRELQEELHLTDARIVRHIGDIDLPSGYRMSHFHVEIPPEAEPSVVDHEELIEARWMSLDDVEKALKSLPPELANKALAYARELITTLEERQTIA
ncbi:MAG TPA: NUDIX domain-containing protein [Candidatus Dormibacteraeota bacterium]|nr:NUDIX domain-containing protein [Candidatus Dormibacteraeota bacterium]